MIIDYQAIAKRVIETEILGLRALEDALDEKFVSLIELILGIKGRVILSGMGKSGHIAKKISATLASTGTSAFFIHPSEASHGDLGMIAKEDIVILLSNSGETKELMDIIHYCKRFDIPIIGIVRRKTSLLVQASKIAIILPDIAEASIIDAPTTSTSMMLAFGDAVAVTLSETKGFSKEDFGSFHPGGKLGNQFILVENLMRKDEHIPVCNLDTKMSETILEMSRKSIGCVAVVDQMNHLQGIITDGDLRRHMSNDLINQTASEVMSAKPKIISKFALAIEAVSFMEKYKITSVFVTENDLLIGVIHIHDCLKAGVI